MNAERYNLDLLKRRAETVLYLVVLVGLLIAAGYVVLGVAGIVWAAVAVALGLGVAMELPVRMLARVNGGFVLNRAQAYPLHQMVAELTRRIGLPQVPHLIYVPGGAPQAFAGITREGPAIGVTAALLDQMTERELRGVLAHEMAHIHAGDTRLLSAARVLQSVTGRLAFLGWLWLAVSLLSFGLLPLPAAPGILLIALPIAGRLAELALSRAREFHADLEAARITHDPGALATALDKLEGWQRRRLGPFATVLKPPERWSSHPATRERIRRLRALEQHSGVSVQSVSDFEHDLPHHLVRFQGPVRRVRLGKGQHPTYIWLQ